MKTPSRIAPLIEDGIVDEVIRPLMSGKEAAVFIVRCGDDIRCAKVYKDAAQRSFKQAVHYQEGRKVRNSRQARAMEKRSKFGKAQQEENWQNAEVDALYKLASAGVRVPKPYGCFEGVLIMEMISDEEGHPAPRLNDVSMSAEEAIEDHATMIHYIKLMLIEGLVHGDLSEFNVLVDPDGPVIIDLPQAVDASANNHAQWMLQRDVENIRDYYGIYAPSLLKTRYAPELWDLYQSGELKIDSVLSGEFKDDTHSADVDDVMVAIIAAMEEAKAREAGRIAKDAED